MSRISVVIPCYNRADIVSRAIQSAKAQTVAPYEIIVVDDGSKDGSAEVAKRFGGNVIVIEQENKGAAAARNRGIQYALGEWIAFLDSDDEWHPQKLELQFAAASQFSKAQLIFCDTIVKSNSEVILPSRFALGGVYGSEIDRMGDYSLYDRSLFAKMLSQSRVISSAVLVRRTLPELLFPDDIWGSEDWSLWLILSLHYNFASVNRVLVTMHQQGDNISSQKARLYRNDVLVLERLNQLKYLSSAEETLVGQQIQERRLGAAYFSLLAGDGKEARLLLNEISAYQLGLPRFIVYRLLSYIPKTIMSMLLGVWLRNRFHTGS